MRYLISCLCSTVIKSFQCNSNNKKQGSWKKKVKVEGQKKKRELFDCHFVLADNNTKFKGKMFLKQWTFDINNASVESQINKC